VNPRAVAGVAFADVRDRIRRPSFVVILLAAIGLGYVAAPDADARWVVMYVGEHRGIYDSDYMGALLALASALWLTLGGFYILRDTVRRDERSGVGELLAATPLLTRTYLAGKLTGGCLVLGSMVGVLAVTALVLQLARGESRTIDPVGLILPFLLIAMPLVVVTSAAVIVFETTPILRTGLGNILWFFGWLVLAIGGQSPDAPLGGIGVGAIALSFRDSMIAQGIDVSEADFSLGLVYLDQPLRTFDWGGFSPSVGYVADRLTLVAVAVLVALLPALWFGRFDPSRSFRRPRTGADRAVPAVAGAPGPYGGSGEGVSVPVASPRVRAAAGARGPAGEVPVVVAGAPAPVAALRAIAPGRKGMARLVVGELRILVQGASWWWWLGTAALAAAALVVPRTGVAQILLPLAWIWPVLLWSRLGAQRFEHSVDVLLGAYPRVRRRLLAEWIAGVVFTSAVGLGPMVRFLALGDGPGVAAWAAGALLIPSLALLLGSLSRTQRFFQAVYVLLWYAVVNGIAIVDFMGAVREDGVPVGPDPFAVAGLAIAMLVVVLLVGGLRREGRR
jgi:hypothetical protein